MDEIQKKILISAESKLGTVKDDLLELNDTLTDQLTAQKLLELQGKRNTQQYIETASQVRITKQSIRDLNREYDNAVRAFKCFIKFNTAKPRIWFLPLTAEYIKLSQTEGFNSRQYIALKGYT